MTTTKRILSVRAFPDVDFGDTYYKVYVGQVRVGAIYPRHKHYPTGKIRWARVGYTFCPHRISRWKMHGCDGENIGEIVEKVERQLEGQRL